MVFGVGATPGTSSTELLEGIQAAGAVTRTPSSGYLHKIGTNRCSRSRPRPTPSIHLPYRPGPFLVRGHVSGPHHTLTQDISFGFDQLVKSPCARCHRRSTTPSPR